MAALALLALIPLPALADCMSPAGVEADMFYNTTHKRVQYCDGTNWVNMGVSSAGSSDNLGNHTATQALAMANFKITGLATPTAAADAVTKAYVDGLVGGGDNLGNHTATQALAMGGFNITGAAAITASSEITGTLGSGFGQFRAVAGNYGSFIRNDGGVTYWMLTNSGNQYGGWNALRPFHIENANGNVYFANGTVSVNHATGIISGNGSGLTTLNASNITSGTVPTARLGSGTANATTYLRGDGAWVAIAGGGPGTLSRAYTQYATAGTFTWTKPANAELVWVQCWGSGGAGQRGGSPTRGAGGGGYGSAWYIASELPATVTVTVPAGTPGATGATAASGSPASFGTFLVANGGSSGTSGGNGGTVTFSQALSWQGEFGGTGALSSGTEGSVMSGGGGGGETIDSPTGSGSSDFGGDGGSGGGGNGGTPGGGGGGKRSNSGSSGAGGAGECRVTTMVRS